MVHVGARPALAAAHFIPDKGRSQENVRLTSVRNFLRHAAAFRGRRRKNARRVYLLAALPRRSASCWRQAHLAAAGEVEAHAAAHIRQGLLSRRPPSCLITVYSTECQHGLKWSGRPAPPPSNLLHNCGQLMVVERACVCACVLSNFFFVLLAFSHR